MTSYLIRGARPYGGDPVDVLLADGRIAAIGEGLSATGAEVVEAAGLVALTASAVLRRRELAGAHPPHQAQAARAVRVTEQVGR